MTRRSDTRRSTALTWIQQPSIYDQRDYAAGCSTAFGMQEPYHPGTRASTRSFLPGVEYLNEYGQPLVNRREVTINPRKYADMDRDTTDVARRKTAQYLGVTEEQLRCKDPLDRATQVLMAKVDNHKMKPREAGGSSESRYDREYRPHHSDASSSESGSSGHGYIDLKPEETIVYHPRQQYGDYRSVLYRTGGSATQHRVTHAPSPNMSTNGATNVSRFHGERSHQSLVPHRPRSKSGDKSTKRHHASSYVQDHSRHNPIRRWVATQAVDPTYSSRPGQFDAEKKSSGMSHRVYKYW